MLTVRNLVVDALLELNAIGYGDPLDSDLGDLGLRWVTQMLDANQADPYLLFTVARTLYTLIANQQAHTIGSGGDFAGARPEFVSHVGVIPADQTELEIPLDRYESREEWFAEPLKGQTDLYPRRYLYEPTSATLGTFTFWPVPTTAAQVAISSPVALTAPVTLNTVLAWPPGYAEAWRLNLARKLARPLGRPMTADLVMDAEKALSVIRRVNDPGPPRSRSDAALCGRGGYDIRSNQYR